MHIDTGARDSSSSGYYFGTMGQTDLKVAVKVSDVFYYYKFTPGESWRLNHWIHVAFTWEINDGIRFYINGCSTDPDDIRGYAYTIPRNAAWAGHKSFLIGADIGYIHMYMDEFYIWHTALTPRQMLYGNFIAKAVLHDSHHYYVIMTSENDQRLPHHLETQVWVI